MGPGEIDIEVIRRHLAALREALAVLAARSDVSPDELEADTELLWIVERGLQLCCQNVLDIATHIAAGRGRDIPDYASAIDELGHLGVLDAEFTREFRNLAGFRNVLVHGYLEVDLGLLHRLVSQSLDDFESFAAQVEAFIETL